jgi:signal peptidase II
MKRCGGDDAAEVWTLKNKRLINDLAAGAGIALPVLALDRLTKIWAENCLAGAPDIIPGVLGLRLARNTGVAFSMFSGARTITIVFTSLVILGIIIYLLCEKRPSALGRAGRAGLWLFAAGGLGNLYDRLVYGYVVDMIEFRFIDFAVFNVADISVCLGAFLVALGYLRAERARMRVTKQ